MKKINILISIVLLSFILFFITCDPIIEYNDKSITITGLGWYIENIDSTFWTGTPLSAHCFYDFFIQYDGNISLGDIEYARVYVVSDNYYWTIPLTPEYFNSQDKVIGGWYRFYDGTNGNILPIGDLRAVVKIKKGKTSSFVKTIPAPGSSTTNGKQYVYTPEDYSTGSSSYTPMIRRATIGIRTINIMTQAMEINFTVNDNLVYSGYVFLYDTNGDYVGYSKTFRDETNGSITSIINSGAGLYINGDNNKLTISNPDVTLMTGKTFNEIF